MHHYLIRRLLMMIPTLFIISIIVFLMISLIPGDVIDSMMQQGFARRAGGGLDREALERALGLDVPMYVQYGRWIGDIFLHGSLGDSLRTGEPVVTTILGKVATTVELGLMAIVISVMMALPIGIYSAIRQDTVGDYTGRSIAIIFIAVPSFRIATMIMLYPSILWGWSPPVPLIPFREDPLGNLGQFFIPSFILGMAMAGMTMRMTRTMMLEVLRQDYIRTAWSKGLKERLVVRRHALKNALIPVVTIVGAELPVLVGGAIIFEQIFALPGIGRLLLVSLSDRDYTLVSGVNLVIASGVVVANLLVDISYAYLDPRVRYR
ncbi:MAG: ABC transporter permease [Dehalococcoidia bacterium]|nr:ABC transporter permease [Dehalococcoidia bacterium]